MGPIGVCFVATVTNVRPYKPAVTVLRHSPHTRNLPGNLPESSRKTTKPYHLQPR